MPDSLTNSDATQRHLGEVQWWRRWLRGSRAPSSNSQQVAKFNLLTSFSGLSLLLVLLICVVTSFILSRFLEQHLLRRDSVVLDQFVGRIAQHHDPHGYFAATYGADGDDLNDFFNDIAHMPDVARINAYTPAGAIVWSSDRGMVGRKFTDNEELSEALRGELVYKKGQRSRSEKAEHVRFSRDVDWFVENYIPIADRRTGRIVGVVEIYRIPVALAHSIAEGRLLVWGSICVGGMLLYLALFGIVQRAHRLIQSQHSMLLKQTRLATIGEMASSVAHSIRNPIASIRSSAELALEDELDAQTVESLEDIIGEVDRFDGWVRELLAFANEHGDPRAEADLSAVVIDSLAACSTRAKRQQVVTQSKVDADLPPVRGEARLLVQIVNSLLANSLDAMPKGGSLQIDGERCPAGVRLSVNDSGVGIPADRISGLFDPLVSHKRGGLGIGLALARQVVERYGGSITLTSTVGLGTTVCIDLPVGESWS